MAKIVMVAGMNRSMGCLDMESIGAQWIVQGFAHFFGNQGVIDTVDAIEKAVAASVPWTKILAILGPILASLLQGQPITLQQIVDAILALINPTPAPTPAPVLS